MFLLKKNVNTKSDVPLAVVVLHQKSSADDEREIEREREREREIDR